MGYGNHYGRNADCGQNGKYGQNGQYSPELQNYLEYFFQRKKWNKLSLVVIKQIVLNKSLGRKQVWALKKSGLKKSRAEIKQGRNKIGAEKKLGPK